uniref:Transcription factor bHLH62 n=1 Tax=Nothapodytes nimmoniana TaxID=159386 RepID=A0A9E8Z3C1_NOTNI|nr:transcription factor bHLH62 [Nothapodytes nimmoniana]
MMDAGNPDWWSNDVNNSMRPPPPLQQITSPLLATPSILFPPPPSPIPTPLSSPWHDNQELPESWSQLFLGGLVGEEGHNSGKSHMQENKELENSEEQLLVHTPNASAVDIKQENSANNSYAIANSKRTVEFHQAAKPTWSQMMPAPDHPPEFNRSATGGAQKKARVQSSSSQYTIKVRKEKLGDRITALHQIVSPFGKTDTASVLLESFGYIRFLQSQIETLSLPYLGSGSSGNRSQQLTDDDGEVKDLKSRGLCLVPVSCTLQFGSYNGADYWTHAFGSFQ